LFTFYGFKGRMMWQLSLPCRSEFLTCSLTPGYTGSLYAHAGLANVSYPAGDWRHEPK